MDFKSLITKLDSMESPPETPKAPELPKAIRLDEDAELRVLAGTSSVLAEAEIMEKKLTKAEKEKKEEVVKSMKKDKAGFKERYGKRGEEVMHATATKIAKKKAESVESSNETLAELDMNLIKAAQKGQEGKPIGKADPESDKNVRKKYGYRMDGEPAERDSDETKQDRRGRKRQNKGESMAMEADGEEGVEDLMAANQDESEGFDRRAFESKFSKMVEAKKSTKGKKAEEKMDEGKKSKPDFLDVDKDGDKKEPMKKAAKEADKGEDKKETKGLSAKQKKLPPGLQKAIAKKKGKTESVSASKKVVAESVEPKLSFRDMMKLVIESGGQQRIDPLDQTLFAWATRVAQQKFQESKKAEVYAGLVYERMGGRFEMYDVLSEDQE